MSAEGSAPAHGRPSRSFRQGKYPSPFNPKSQSVEIASALPTAAEARTRSQSTPHASTRVCQSKIGHVDSDTPFVPRGAQPSLGRARSAIRTSNDLLAADLDVLTVARRVIAANGVLGRHDHEAEHNLRILHMPFSVSPSPCPHCPRLNPKPALACVLSSTECSSSSTGTQVASNIAAGAKARQRLVIGAHTTLQHAARIRRSGTPC